MIANDVFYLIFSAECASERILNCGVIDINTKKLEM